MNKGLLGIKPTSFHFTYIIYMLFNQGLQDIINYKESESVSCSVSCVRLSATPWTVAPQAPLSIGFCKKEYTGESCDSLLQGIFLTQGSNPGSLHCRQFLYHLSHQGTLKVQHRRYSYGKILAGTAIL